MPAQVVARPDDLVEGCDLEGDVVQLDIRRFRLHRADKRDAVMVLIAAQKDHAAGYHLFRIDVRNLKAENFAVEPCRSLDVVHVDNDVPQPADPKRKAVWPL